MVRSIALLLLQALLLVVAFSPARAQSDYLGERFPYWAFDQLESVPVKVGGGTLAVAFAPGELALPPSAIIDWLERSAEAASVYFGRFPVAYVRVLIVPVSGRGVQTAAAFGFLGPAIRLLVGSDATAADLLRDWKAVHEMMHLAQPDISGPHLWLAEGIATYVEPIARVQAGQLSAEKIWGDMLRDMPNGMPQAGDRGLDRTPTWGRTYWGGAIFCLVADIEIRKATGNKFGLQQALRAILEAGGTIDQPWSIERVIRVGDQATGTRVLADLYAKMRDKPYAPDLDALWAELGVSERQGRVTFDDSAPLASIRRAITAPPPR